MNLVLNRCHSNPVSKLSWNNLSYETHTIVRHYCYLYCCKLRRLLPQDGSVGSLKDTVTWQCVTSNVLVATLDFCSDDAHNIRAIPLIFDWDDAVRQGNKFMRREVKQTKHLSEMTDAGVCEQRTPNIKPERPTRMDVQPNIYMPAKVPTKCPGKPTAQFKPITSNSSSKINCPNVSQYATWL